MPVDTQSSITQQSVHSEPVGFFLHLRLHSPAVHPSMKPRRTKHTVPQSAPPGRFRQQSDWCPHSGVFPAEKYLLAKVIKKGRIFAVSDLWQRSGAKVRAMQELRGMEWQADVHKLRAFISLPIFYQHLSNKYIAFSSCFLQEYMNNQATIQLSSLEINVLVK